MSDYGAGSSYGSAVYGTSPVTASLAGGGQSSAPLGLPQQNILAMLRSRRPLQDVFDPLLAQMVRGY